MKKFLFPDFDDARKLFTFMTTNKVGNLSIMFLASTSQLYDQQLSVSYYVEIALADMHKYILL